MEIEKRIRYYFIFILILFFVGRFLYSVIREEYIYLLWFCFLNLGVLIIGLYFKKDLLIGSVLTSSFFIGILVGVDLISYGLFGKLFFGVTNYLYEFGTTGYILTFYHVALFAVPTYVVLREKKFSKYSWVFSSLFLLTLSIISLLMGAGETNCAIGRCNFGVFNFLYFLKPLAVPFFIFHWLFFTLFVFIPTQVIFYFFTKE